MFVYGIFRDEEKAAKAVEALVDADFPGDAISALMREGSEVEELPVEKKTRVGRGAVLGAALGAVGGALLAPGAGLLAGGPLLVAIKGAIAAGAAGAGLGSFGGLGFWREEIDFVDRSLEAGVIIVGVETNPERHDSAAEVLRAAGAQDVQARTKDDVMDEGDAQ
jgi:hypothetical protein